MENDREYNRDPEYNRDRDYDYDENNSPDLGAQGA